jgi:penicillin-binding protein 2
MGYVGEISEQDLGGNVFPGSKIGSLVGKAGIERIYNKYLAGKDGERHVLVDSLGRENGILDETESTIGNELQLTLDLDLQSIAEKALEGKVGAIIAMDPRNGEILAMASAPCFDPNAFSPRISASDWKVLRDDPDHPLQNRAIQNSYSPGSIFKVIMAHTGLFNGLLDDDPVVTCTGGASYYGRTFHCMSKHGSLRLEQAIAKSCNIFFYELGRRLGIAKIAEHAHSLGLGERTGVDLPNERNGVMPSQEWKMKIQHANWYAGETISVSIGQGAVSTTPLQIIRAISAIATGGLVTTPHLLLRAENADPVNWPVHRIAISEEKTRRIREGMWQSVNEWGTGHNAAVPGLDVCGKTGTVQVIGNENRRRVSGEDFEDHSWFAGFANRDNPEIAVVVFIEHGGKGGVAAAPLAKDIFAAYFSKKKNREFPAQSSQFPAQKSSPETITGNRN